MASNDKAIAEMGLDLTDLQKQITVAVAELQKINTAAQSVDKSVKQVGKASAGAAKEVGFLGSAAKVAASYFAATKLIDYAKGLYSAYINARNLRLELESTSAKRGAQFQTAAQIEGRISGGQDAVGKTNEFLGLSDVKDDLKTNVSAAKQGLLSLADSYSEIYNGIFNNDTREIDSTQKLIDAKKQALSEIAKLQQQYFSKQSEETKAGIKAEFEDSVQGQKDLIEIKRKEQIGALSSMDVGTNEEKEAKKTAEDAIKSQAKLQSDSLDKQHDILLASLDVRNTISQVAAVGYGLQQQSLDVQIEENKNLISSGKLNADEIKNLKAQTAEYEKQKRDSMSQYELEKNQVTLQTQAQVAEMSGQSQEAAILKINLQYNQQIAQAKKEGKDAVAAELTKQQALSQLAERAKEHDKTPQEKRAQLDEDLRSRRSLRAQNQREKQFNEDEDKRTGGGTGGLNHADTMLGGETGLDYLHGKGTIDPLGTVKKKRDYKVPGTLGADKSNGAINAATLTITGGVTTDTISVGTVQSK